MKLWTPGPTDVRPALLAELARPLISHRSEDFARLLERLDPGLAQLFGLWEDTRASVAVADGSATAMMEAALHGAGERVLAIVGGHFGARWAEIARLLEKDLRILPVNPGALVRDTELADVLDREGPFDAVTLVVNETSTGACTPILHVSNVLQAFPETLLLCDVVSYLGGAPVEFDEHCLGFAFAGVQKCLALPPGISVLCASEEYRERARARPRRSYALDPLRILDGHRGRNPPATPALPQIAALAAQLEAIAAEGLPVRFARHLRMRDQTLAWARGHGLEPLAEEALRSPTVSCFHAGALDVPRFIAGLRTRGYQISNGRGELCDKVFRIAHLGDHTEAELAELLAAADEVLASPSAR
jgi:aspartate aminotransferase-like enzyme